MKPARKIIVNAPSKRYAVYCGEGAVNELSDCVPAMVSRPAFFLSSPKIWKHVGNSLKRFSKLARPGVILFDDAESSKNLATVERISRELIRAAADRNAVLVSVGGG